MMEYKEGGLKEEGGGVDPVSGNEVPPGALAEEVRDDIPAQLSEGEFVFPADVVRYIGLEKLMMMRQQAKQGLMRMEEMGQMSNADEATMEGEPPAEYFDIPDDMEIPQAALILEMNEGGSVNKSYKSFEELMGFKGGSTEQTGYNIVEYVNEQGRKILVVEVDGVPTNEVPEGFVRGEVRTEDGVPVDGAAKEEKPQQQTQTQQPPPPQQDNSDEGPQRPEDRGGSTIVTGGFHNVAEGTIEGGTKWSMDRNLDGSVTLNNSQYGEVTLSPEEAANLQLGSGTGGIKGNISDVLAGFKTDSKARQTGILSTGVKGDPTKGNQVHKALVERAELQKAGEAFVKGNVESKGLGEQITDLVKGGGLPGALIDAVKGGFKGKPSELEGNIAQILGKPSGQFNKSDFATIGLALSGKGSTAYGTALGTAGGIDSAKLTELTAFIDAVQGKDTGMMSGQTAAAKAGQVKSTVDNTRPNPLTATGSGTSTVGGSFSMAAQMADQDEDDYQGPGNIFGGSVPSQTVDERADEEAAEAEGGSPFDNFGSGDDDNASRGSSFGGGTSMDASGIGGDSEFGALAKGGLLAKKKNSSRKKKKKKRKGLASKK